VHVEGWGSPTPCKREEEEENLFAKKAGCQKGLQPINAGYRKHKHYMLNNKSMSSVKALTIIPVRSLE